MMRYHEPDSIGEVIALLKAEPEARCLAGGMTLMAMMNAALLAPPVLVSLRRVAALTGIAESTEGLRIGAMTTHREVAAERRLVGAARVVSRAAGQIAHPSIRNVGTIGGSISHGDPSTDLPTALTVADARIAIAGPDGNREIGVEEFFEDYLETALRPGEIVTSVLIPPGPREGIGDYFKFSRVEGDFAIVSVAAVVSMSEGICTYARIALGSCGPRPLRVVQAEERLVGSRLSPDDLAEVGEMYVTAADPVDDVRGTADYRRLLIPRMLAHAVESLRGGDDG